MEAEAVQHAAGPGAAELFGLITLLLVVLIIYLAGRKPISAMLKGRSETIERQLVDAKLELEKMRHETEKARAEIAAIGQTKEQMLSDIEREGERLYSTMVADAKDTAERILADAKLAASSEAQSASAKLREELVSKAVERASLIIANPEKENTRREVHRKLFEKLSSQVSKLSGDANG